MIDSSDAASPTLSDFEFEANDTDVLLLSDSDLSHAASDSDNEEDVDVDAAVVDAKLDASLAVPVLAERKAFVAFIRCIMRAGNTAMKETLNSLTAKAMQKITQHNAKDAATQETDEEEEEEEEAQEDAEEKEEQKQDVAEEEEGEDQEDKEEEDAATLADDVGSLLEEVRKMAVWKTALNAFKPKLGEGDRLKIDHLKAYLNYGQNLSCPTFPHQSTGM